MCDIPHCANVIDLLPSPPLTKRRYCAAWRHALALCVCPPIRLYHVSAARRISLGGEGIHCICIQFQCSLVLACGRLVLNAT